MNTKSSRSFKLQPKAILTSIYYGTYKFVPELRISGKWLADQGFEVGAMVEIMVRKKKLIIKPKAPVTTIN